MPTPGREISRQQDEMLELNMGAISQVDYFNCQQASNTWDMRSNLFYEQL